MIRKFKPVYIEWIDSTTATEWETLDYWESERCANMQSVGFEIKKTDKYIVIAVSVGNEPDQTCGAMTIPMCSVISIKYLKGIK